MQKVVHRAETRGHANHGWLDSHHTFSFAGYYDPKRMHFGQLRVLNDDIVAGGQGFGSHPHDNMEIVSIPLYGSLEHQDNTGNKGVIKAGDVQIMSAGTGIVHSEYNHSGSEEVNFLQIWVFPKERNIQPRYGQKFFAEEGRLNKIQTMVSPEENGALWINQDAYFSRAKIEKGKSLDYELHGKRQGVYLFVIDGEVKAADEGLKRRDGAGFWETDKVELTAEREADVLFVEVPV